MNKRPANQRLVQAVRTICGRRPGLSAPAVALFGFSMVSVALAGPTGGVVVDGQATISTPAAGTTVIDQASQHAQLNWNTFDVGANESVQFNQPSSSSVALNRILDQNPSQIFGRIDANGQVILVNPNGMLFGHSAQLNVGSLVASSLDVIGFDAATGRYTFGTSRADAGAIVNDGAIAAARGGSVTLLGGRVTNNGSIVADFGTVNLAAGRAATLDLAGDGLLRLEVDGELLTNNAGASAAVENNGVIEANGGQVLLTAKAVDDVFANLVNNSGVVRANRIDNSGGTIRLMGAGGTVRSSGVLDASAGDAVSSGGRVEMLGEQVGLFDSALVDVSGATNGGTALIGGDYQGKNPDVLNAARTYVSSDASIRADAGLTGDGGRVIVWADEITRFSGSISARGGALSGDGGLAEVSGKEHLVFRGRADLTAVNGDVGSLLLDPTNITIDNSSATDTDADDGTYAFAEDAGDATIGNATIEALLETTDVVLQATNNITQDADATIDVSGVAGASGSSLTLEAGENITLNGAIITNNGAVNLIADSAAAPGTGGDGTGAITMQDGSSIDAGSADVTLTGAEDIRITSITTTGDVTVTSSGGAIINDGDDATSITGGALTLSGTAIGALANRIDTNATSLSATATNGGIFITEADALSLTADATGGAVDVQTTNGGLTVTSAAGDGVTLTAGGAGNGIMLNGAVNAGADDVTLTAGTLADRGTIVASASSQITGDALTVTGSAIGTGTARLNTTVASLDATSTSGGIFINETNALSLTADATGGAVDVQTANGALTVSSATGAGVTLTAGGDGNGITLNGAVNAGTDDVTLTAGTLADRGTIVAGTSNQVTADSLTATGSAIGTSSARLNTTVASLDATSTDGGIFITETNALSLAAGATGGAVDVQTTNGALTVSSVTGAGVTLTAGGAGNGITLNGAVNAGTDDVTLTAGTAANRGAIVAGTSNQVTADSLTATGSAIGTSGARLNTTVGSLNSTSTNGGIFITETNALSLTADATGGAVNVQTTNGALTVTSATGAGVTLTAGGAGNGITLNGAVNAGTEDVTLTAGTLADRGTIVAGTSNQVTADSLTATGSAIGTSSARLNTTVGSLNATSTNGGIFITETNALSLTADATGGAVNVQTTNGALTVTSATGDGVTLTAGGAGNGITLDGVVNAGADDVVLTAGSVASRGAIVAGVANQVTADSLTAIGSAIGTNAARLNTTVASLEATTTNGGIFVTETNGLTLANINAAGAGSDVSVTSSTGDIVANTVTAVDDVTLTATAGDIQVASITAADAVTLIATAGSIVDDGVNATRIAGGNLTLDAGAGIGAIGATGDIDTEVSSLTASAGFGGVYIGEQNGLTLTNVSAAGPGGNVNVTSATGDIVVGSISAFDAVTLTAAAGAIIDDDNNASVISGARVSLSAATNIGTVVDFDAANDAAVGSSLDVQTNALTVSVASNNGQINLNISGVPFLAAGAITLGSGSNRSGAIVLQSAGDLNAAGLAPGAINIGSNNTTQLGLRSGGVLTLPASGGFTDQPVDQLLVRGATDVVDNDASPRELSLVATTLDFRSGAAGGATILNTTVGRLNATVGNDQNLTVNETNGLTLGTLDTGNGNITLTAGGAIIDDGDDLTRIVSNTAALSGTSLGTAGNALDTRVNTLTASATSGGVHINEVDALALTVSATGGAADVRTAGGSLTVASATGDGVTLIAGGAGSDITLNGALNAGAGDVTLTTGTAANRGAIVAGTGHYITGDALTATGSTIGTSAARLNTSVASLNATSSNGGIFITEADALSLAANANGGAVDVATTNGALTVTQATGNAVTLTAGGAGSGITLNGAVNAGAGDVTLTAGTAASRGAIVAALGNQITGNALTATGASIGTDSARLNTSVASLDATSTNGGIFITEANALNLTASATNGVADVRTTNGALAVTSVSGNGVTLTAGGAGAGITLNGAVNAGAGDVTLTAGTAASRGAIVGGAGHQITGNALTATASMIGTGAARLNTSVASLSATSTNGGIFVTETDALSLAASANGGAVDVAITNGALTVTQATGNAVTLTAGGAGNGITLNGAVNAGTGDVTLTAGTAASRGAIVAGAGHQITGGSLTATGSAIGTSAARLNTSVASLNTTSTNGGIFITESDALSLTANASGGAVDVATANGALTVTQATGNAVTLTAGGAGNGITLNGTVNAGAGDVTLTTGTAANRGAIVAGAGSQITGGSLVATGATIGTGAARLNTSVASVNATSSNGGIFITETDALNLAASATGGVVDVQTGNGSLTVAAVSGDGVTLTAGGAGSGITLNGQLNAGAGDVTLTAGTTASRGAIVGSAGHSISGRSLTATAAAIGASNARLNTSIDTLTALASTGDVYINEQNGLTLANVSGGRDIGVTSVAGNIIVNTVAATNAVTLTATSGAIVDDGDDTTLLSANALTLSARSIGAASTLSGTTLNSAARLDTDVETLNATATQGGIFIDEANGLQNVSVQASGGDAGDIELLTRSGDLILQNVRASDTLLLAAGRNIFAAPGAGPVTARVAEVRAGATDAGGGLIGRPTDLIEFQLSAGNSLRLFVPQTVDPNDPNRSPATQPSAGVSTTLSQFASPTSFAVLAGFNQFQGFGEIEFTSPAEALVRTLQSQTGTVQAGLDIDWGSFDPEVSLFGTLEPSVCLPGDQRDEEVSTPDC